MELGKKGHAMMDSMTWRFQNRIKAMSVNNALYEIGNVNTLAESGLVVEQMIIVTLTSLKQLRMREDS